MTIDGGEFGVISDLLAPLAADGAFALTDDAALLPELPPGQGWVVTKDAMVAGVHFLPSDPPDMIARKLLRVNLSDLAAMGAVPRGYLLATAWTAETDRDWISRFVDGLARDQARFSVGLFGGDTVSTPGPLTFSLTALGTAARDGLLRRNGALAGDDIYVSGTLGDSALGLRVLRDDLEVEPEHATFLSQRYHLPQPRTTLGPALVGLASAAQDVSDGLLADLGHVARQSGVGAEVHLELLPLSVAAREVLIDHPDLALLPLHGGDDYELVFTASPGRRDSIRAAADASQTPVTRIGRMTGGAGVQALAAGRPLTLKDNGWKHF
ncbi:MAG: thiamine-phosphate kinase [Minwuia sp.]|nr:thiamine-phosphate kinase [Minwuia sp.]